MDATAESAFHPNRFLRDLPALSLQYEIVARGVGEWAAELPARELERLPRRLQGLVPKLDATLPTKREACVLGLIRDSVLGRTLSCCRAEVATLNGEYIFGLLTAYDRYVEAGCRMFQYPTGWVESVRNRQIDPLRLASALAKQRPLAKSGYVHLGLSSGTMVGSRHYLDGLYFSIGDELQLEAPADSIREMQVTLVCRDLLDEATDNEAFDPRFHRMLCAPFLHIVFDLSRPDPAGRAYKLASSAPITRDEEFSALWTRKVMSTSIDLALGAIAGLFRTRK